MHLYYNRRWAFTTVAIIIYYRGVIIIIILARNKQRPITVEELEQIKSIIIYDHQTGYLYKRSKHDGVLYRCGWQHPSGYRQVSVIGRNIYEHRLAWALYYGEDPYPLEIDHINRNRGDNIISNLRRVTILENAQNKTPSGPIILTTRQRQSQAAFNRWANTTPEERRALALHRWEVRREKQTDRTFNKAERY